jgi:hypothetical protein
MSFPFYEPELFTLIVADIRELLPEKILFDLFRYFLPLFSGHFKLLPNFLGNSIRFACPFFHGHLLSILHYFKT